MKKESFDPGLTTQFSGELRRTINPDGSFNVKRSGLRWRDANPYLMLIDTTWPRFLLIVLLAFLSVNMIFASFYLMIGIEKPVGPRNPTWALSRTHFSLVSTPDHRRLRQCLSGKVPAPIRFRRWKPPRA